MAKLLLILCVVQLISSPAAGIVFRVVSTNKTARLKTVPNQDQLPTTTSPTKPVRINLNPVITKRKYINDDYFSTADENSFVDPWHTSLSPSKPAPIRQNTNGLENSLLQQLLWSKNLENSHKFMSPFGEPKALMPLYWGLSGYGHYSYAAGNDLHNNQPIGNYKHVRYY